MHAIDNIYGLFVNRIPGIREKYKKKRNQVKGIGRGSAWLYLLWLNFRYYILRDRKLEHVEKYPYYEEKLLYSGGSESSISSKRKPEELAEALAKYDVISFDVFDTLVLRPFSSPTDLFFVLGNELNYMDFQRIRVEMEWKAREKKYKKEKHYEVTLEEIYTLLSEETGIEKQEAMRKEVELEYTFCFANPYMKRVVDLLKEKGKRLIVTSDMYLNTEQIKKLLELCGYMSFDSYYVSCDQNKSKNEGGLYRYVKQIEGENRTYAHVGDNYISDVKNSEKQGFAPFHYVNVNAVGEPYRPYDMSVITGSLYRGIVNAHIHNGLHCYSREYEYGYIYGGLFVTGYCQFIHEYVKSHGIDKILFLARDGDVLSKAYEILYPEEKENWEYVYWSRLAATKMAASRYKYDYFRRFLYHKVNQGYTIRQIFSSMEVEDMLEELYEHTQFTEQTLLSDCNVEKVKNYLMKNWQFVLAHYEEQLQAGKLYYEEVLQDCKKVVAVDIGWAGSGAITLDYIVNHIWELDCEIIGMIAGTNTCHNAEPNASETFLQSGKLVSYLYSQRENRDLWKFHDAGKDHNLFWEMLLDAPMGSLKGFYLKEEQKWRCEFKDVTVDIEKISEVQRGILDFVQGYTVWSDKMPEMAKICGRDAYAPMVMVEGKMNSLYRNIFIKMVDEKNIGAN